MPTTEIEAEIYLHLVNKAWKRLPPSEQKSTLELEFMNQLTGVARENALKLEELEGRLAETTNVNAALNEQLRQGLTVDSLNQQIEALDAQHRKDLAQTIDVNKAEIQKTRHRLQTVMDSRDKLLQQFDQAKRHLLQKEKEIESLQASHRTSDDRDALSQELQQTKAMLATKDAQIETLKQQLQTTEQTSKAQLEETQRELANLKLANQTLEIELKNVRTNVNLRQTEAESAGASKAKSDSIKIKVQEANIRELTNQLEECKSNLSSAEYEIDRFKSTFSSNEASLRRQLEEKKKENMELKATVESQEKALEQQLKETSYAQVKVLEEEKAGLKEIIHKMEAEKMEQKLEMTRLQKAKKELVDKYEHDIRTLKKHVDHAPFDEQLPIVVPSNQVPKKIVPSIQNVKTKEMLGHAIKGRGPMQSPTEGQMQPKKLFGRL